jgi:hypothetical protein
MWKSLGRNIFLELGFNDVPGVTIARAGCEA